MNPAFTCTRLAPSPTGSLHLGHARTFLITWWLARQAGARVIFRMEDLDTRRAKPESVRVTYEDLRWLGIDWDVGPPASHVQGDCGLGADGEEYIQSRRLPHYAAALEQLWQCGAIYPCTCSRADVTLSVAQSVGAPQEGDVQLCYPGTCRGRAEHHDRRMQATTDVAARIERETGKPACWRLRVPPGPVAFDDLAYGAQSWDVAGDSGDFPLTRFDGTPAYQLAVVVDDAAMAVDCVIRGDDLLSSTPRQLLLYRALGLAAPRFLHIPLVVGADGKRLAKRHGESRIAQFRAAGVAAESMVGWAAWRAGQIETPRKMRADEMIGRFDLARMPRERLVLGGDDLTWLTAR